MCFDFLYNICLKHFSFLEEMNAIWQNNCIGLHVKFLYYCPILMKHEFSRTDFRKDFHIPNFMKIRPVGVELSHEDGQTERHYDANSRFFAILRKLLKSCKTISSRCLCVLAFQILTNWPIFNTTNANLMPLMATTRPCFFQFPKTGHNKKNVVTTEAGTTTEMM